MGFSWQIFNSIFVQSIAKKIGVENWVYLQMIIRPHFEVALFLPDVLDVKFHLLNHILNVCSTYVKWGITRKFKYKMNLDRKFWTGV